MFSFKFRFNTTKMAANVESAEMSTPILILNQTKTLVPMVLVK